MPSQLDYIVKTVDEIKLNNTKDHSVIVKHQEKTNGNVKLNSEFRLKNEKLINKIEGVVTDVTLFKGGLSTIKWLVAFIGFGNVITVVIYLIN